MNFMNAIVKNAVVLLLAAMVIVVTWQVTSRYVLAAPSPWTEEVARMIMICIGFLGAAYAHHEKAHLGIDLLEQNLSGKNRERHSVLVNFFGILFALAVMVLGGGLLVHLTWELKQTTAVLGVPMSWVYSIIPISGSVICLNGIAFMFEGNRTS